MYVCVCVHAWPRFKADVQQGQIPTLLFLPSWAESEVKQSINESITDEQEVMSLFILRVLEVMASSRANIDQFICIVSQDAQIQTV